MSDILINDDLKRQTRSQHISLDQIPVDTQKKKESKHDLIERNKNIFLIAQMLSIKHDEIQKLEDFQTLREEGLKFYETNLNTDIKQFIEYFKDNREKAREARLLADQRLKEKQQKENELHRLHSEFQAYDNKIRRNQETIKVYKSTYLGIQPASQVSYIPSCLQNRF